MFHSFITDIRDVRPQPRRKLKASSKIQIFPTGQLDNDYPGGCQGCKPQRRKLNSNLVVQYKYAKPL